MSAGVPWPVRALLCSWKAVLHLLPSLPVRKLCFRLDSAWELEDAAVFWAMTSHLAERGCTHTAVGAELSGGSLSIWRMPKGAVPKMVPGCVTASL